MANYLRSTVAQPPALNWLDVGATITFVAADLVLLTNSDGTVTRLVHTFGNGPAFAGTTGAGGQLTQGVISSMSRTNQAGTTTFETISGLGTSAATFSARLAQSGMTGALGEVLNGNDAFTGNGLADRFVGFAGNDTFIGGPGNDTYTGSADDADTVDYSNVVIFGPTPGVVANLWSAGPVSGIPADTVFDPFFSTDTVVNVRNLVATPLADVVVGNLADNRIVLGAGTDSALGLAGNDTIDGGADSDTIDGGAGADSMIGGAGIDIFFVDNAADVVTEVTEAGTFDTIWSTVTYSLPENVEILILQAGAGHINATGNDGPADNLPNLVLGNDGANTIITFSGNDIILGQDHDDVIYAGGSTSTGYDVLAGGRGSDILVGQAGHDYFTYTAFDQGGDVIYDFTVTRGPDLDILDLRPLGFFNGDIAISDLIRLGYLTLTQAGADTQVYLDPDGTNGATARSLAATVLATNAAALQELTLI